MWEDVNVEFEASCARLQVDKKLVSADFVASLKASTTFKTWFDSLRWLVKSSLYLMLAFLIVHANTFSFSVQKL